METDRPHRTTTSSNSSTSELFVCFTSRLSSSSMKLSSKSILSPNRSREPPQISLSSSLSRRLKSNGSMKGGQASPMFPTGGKKRGCAFENPEPSSPKVTCIGQVRVKTKKQGKKMRARSKRRGEASFRKTEQGFQVASNPDLTRQNSQSFQYQNHQQECLRHRNQRWVHLPLTICEALRGFGAEFNCFLPCRSSCMSSEREKEEKFAAAAAASAAEGGAEGSGSGGHGREGSCGAAFGRWLVTLQEGDAKGRERRHVFEDVDIRELVMEEEEEEDDRTIGAERSQRRHVFQDIDIDLEVKKNEEFAGEEEEKGRVSICIPPKNALLLMRCRSDPVKMAALANRFWESPAQKDEGEDEDNGNEVEQEEKEEEEEEEGGEEEQIEMEEDEGVQTKVEEGTICESERGIGFVSSEEHVIAEAIEAKPEVEEEVYEIESRANAETNEVPEANQVKDEEEEEEKVHEDEDDEDGEGNANPQDEIFSGVSTPEVQIDLEKTETEEVQPSLHQEDEEKKLKEKENEESSELASSPAFSAASEPENNEAATTGESAMALAAAVMAETSAEGSTEEEQKGTAERPMEDEETATTCEGSEPRPHVGPESKERGKGSRSESERGSSGLPECLLLMMCEPKLSMEVSKETWVCSTDFIRCLPERPVRKTGGGGGGVDPKKRVSVDSKQQQLLQPPPHPPQLLQPPRSSCSFPAPAGPAGMSMATMIEQKLVGSNAYEPFVLTRCKSEPMRSSAKLAPEACFWKNRKLEPHPPATLGVGAAGVGF